MILPSHPCWRCSQTLCFCSSIKIRCLWAALDSRWRSLRFSAYCLLIEGCPKELSPRVHQRFHSRELNHALWLSLYFLFPGLLNIYRLCSFEPRQLLQIPRPWVYAAQCLPLFTELYGRLNFKSSPDEFPPCPPLLALADHRRHFQLLVGLGSE